MKDKLAAAQAGGGASANNSNTTHNLPSAVYPHQSPFAVPETPAKTLQRVLGYKFVCDMEDERPITITQRDDGGEDGNKYRLTYLDGGGQSYDVTAYLQDKKYDLLPDYDRNSAAFPISRKLMERELPSISKDLTRKVMKLFDSVPEAERGVFMKFVDRGDGITVSVSCVSAMAPLPLRMYTYKVDLVGAYDGGNSFGVNLTKYSQSFAFVGDLQAHCFQRYHKELALLLMHECMTRLSLGTAELSKDVHLGGTDEIVKMISNHLDAMYVEMKRWAELVSLRAWLLERAVKSKVSLQMAASAACSLGEALEACGHYSKAAHIYAEAGKYLYDAKHSKATNLLGNAGLAWKRHGDWEKAESFYAASIESTCFDYDPIEYRSGLLNKLKNLWYLWDQEQVQVDDPAVANLSMALRELIICAGEPSFSADSDRHLTIDVDHIPALRHDLCNISEEQTLRVLKSIAEKSISAEAMRGAIKSCANPYAFEFKFSLSKEKNNRDKRRNREAKDAAREYIQSRMGVSSIVVTCNACGELKDEKAFKKCSAW